MTSVTPASLIRLSWLAASPYPCTTPPGLSSLNRTSSPACALGSTADISSRKASTCEAIMSPSKLSTKVRGRSLAMSLGLSAALPTSFARALSAFARSFSAFLSNFARALATSSVSESSLIAAVYPSNRSLIDRTSIKPSSVPLLFCPALAAITIMMATMPKTMSRVCAANRPNSYKNSKRYPFTNWMPSPAMKLRQ